MPSSIPRDRTVFQESHPYSPRFDIRTDAVMVYGVGPDLAERVAIWRAHGYRVHLMTGLSWGGYQDYLLGRWDGRTHWDDAQYNADGKPKLHGPDIPYMVPCDSYGAYLESLLQQAIEAGVEAIYLEEPEFWSYTGYGKGFEQAWESRYGIPYRDPASDPRSFTLAAELKHALYRELIARLCAAVYRLSSDRPGGPIPCYVATHSLLNYAHWRIVSPVSALREIEHCAGAIVQTWSFTARSQVMYEGTRSERLLEVAFLEYGSGLEIVRGSDRHLWFLVDPVEDSPDHGWDRYRAGYEATVVASLLHPEAGAYEVMPWANRVFTRLFPRRQDGPPGTLIPAAYACEVLVVANAMSNMPDSPLVWDCGTQGLGVLTADSLIFRRGGPQHDDPELSAFYGMALPLLLAGMPVRPVSLEAVAAIGVQPEVHVLLLSYDGMTPPNARAHEQLAAWVRAGNALILWGQADGPYETLQAWWNEGKGSVGPWPHLYSALGVSGMPGTYQVDDGVVRIVREGPVTLARQPGGANTVRACVRETLAALGPGAPVYKEQSHIVLRRGPYVLAAALGPPPRGPQPAAAVHIEGCFVDMFDGDLPIRTDITLQPGQHAFLLDVDNVPGDTAAVLAASARVSAVTVEPRRLHFRLAGPAETMAVARLRLPAAPTTARAADTAVSISWDPASHTARLRHANVPDGMPYTIEW